MAWILQRFASQDLQCTAWGDSQRNIFGESRIVTSHHLSLHGRHCRGGARSPPPRYAFGFGLPFFSNCPLIDAYITLPLRRTRRRDRVYIYTPSMSGADISQRGPKRCEASRSSDRRVVICSALWLRRSCSGCLFGGRCARQGKEGLEGRWCGDVGGGGIIKNNKINKEHKKHATAMTTTGKGNRGHHVYTQ